MFFTGPEPGDIPKIISSCPVDWDYNGTLLNLHFHAGFMGFSQDEEGRLKSCIGWYVTHDPPKRVTYELSSVQKEVADLLKGHADELKNINRGSDWYQRVKVLLNKEKNLILFLDQYCVGLRPQKR